jgi:mannose-6-phosphate isomerase-like protein (cupin superfamily)
MADCVEQIAKMVSALLADLPDACAAPFQGDFPEILTPSRHITPASLPVLQYFAPGGPPLAAHLHEIRHHLAWMQTYAPADFGPEFLEKYGWTEIIGPRGPIPSQKLACGFLLLGPGLTYPDHHHMAEELYIVIAGTASWRRGAENWRQPPPGAVIHHPSDMPHAMKTGDETLLALYFWRAGDLQQKSIF